jgi:signal peptidase
VVKQNDIGRKMKKVIDIIFTVIMIVVLILGFLIAGVRLFGLKPYAVISGSMEPTYHVGSLIYVKKATASDLKVGDPITYYLPNGTVVTHRIVEVIPDEDDLTVVRYRTKGDANNTADGEPVHINNIIGKPVFSIPLIGYISYFVQNPPGSYIVIIIVAALILLSFIPNLYDNMIASNKKKEESASVQAGGNAEDDASVQAEGQDEEKKQGANGEITEEASADSTDEQKGEPKSEG